MDLCEVLETPTSDKEVASVPTVRVVEVEDRFDGFGGFGGESVGADVDPSVDVGGEYIPALTSKGRRIASL